MQAAVVPATPFQVMVSDAKQYFQTKRGKEVLVLGGAALLLIIGLILFARIIRGSPAART
jgi:hypothetical protein